MVNGLGGGPYFDSVVFRETVGGEEVVYQHLKGQANLSDMVQVDVAPPTAYEVTTDDAVRIRGFRYEVSGDSREAIVFAHGFSTSQSKPKIVSLMRRLASAGYSTFSFDFRGHGESDGVCTFGGEEGLDLRAVIAHVRELGFDRVRVVGASMGASVALIVAAEQGVVDGLVSISAPPDWSQPTLFRARVMGRVLESQRGKRLLARRGTRVEPADVRPITPLEAAPAIAPTPVTVIHGFKDAYVRRDAGRNLYEALREPRELIELPWFGHAEASFNERFADLLIDVLRRG